LHGLPRVVDGLAEELGARREVLGRPGRLVHRLTGLIRDLPHSLLRLLSSPAGGVLCLPGRLADGLLYLLNRFVYSVFDPLALGDFVERALDRLVGVDHLLDLRPRVLLLLRQLFQQALQLGTVVLQLALELPDRVAVEVLSAVYRLLLDLLL
jgi:hypothetical protein